MKTLNKVFGFAFLALSVAVLTSCRIVDKEATGKQVTISQSLKPYKQILCSGDMDVTFVQSDSAYVVIKGDEGLIKRMNVYTRREGELVIDNRGDDKNHVSINLFSAGKDGMNVTIYGPAPEKLVLAGSGDLLVKPVKTGAMEISVAGSGDIQLNAFQGGKLRVNLAGAGDVTAKKINAKSVECAVAGSGDVEMELDHSGKVDCNVAGAGDITLTGTCKNVSSSVSGAGNVTNNTREY